MSGQDNEFLCCVNDKGVDVGKKLRGDCHGNPAELHRVVHIIIYDDDGRILAQKRSLQKDIQPGKWDTSVGGHVDPGELVLQSALRECEEEIGISNPELEKLYEYTWISDVESERVTTFRSRASGLFFKDKKEIDDLRFLDDTTFRELSKKNLITPNFIYEKKRYDLWLEGNRKDIPDYPAYSICRCSKCSRLVKYRESIKGRGKLKNARYWNLPVPGFGDLNASILVIGLAPGAHGANRTGRPFTGDAAGDLLFGALYAGGFASRPDGVERGDGLWLKDVFISNAVKCVPPENKPVSTETRTCMEWMDLELSALSEVKLIICLGRLAFNAVKQMLKTRLPDRSRWKGCDFGHGKVFRADSQLPVIAGLYHPSRRNLNTGLITRESFTNQFLQVCSSIQELH